MISYNNLGKGVNGDYFKVLKVNNDKYKPLEYYIDMIKFNEYYIYKCSRSFKEVSIEDFHEFKYSGYIFFKKSLYNNEDINKWVDIISNWGGVMYLSKPFPSIEYLKKIKVYE